MAWRVGKFHFRYVLHGPVIPRCTSREYDLLLAMMLRAYACFLAIDRKRYEILGNKASDRNILCMTGLPLLRYDTGPTVTRRKQ